MNGPQVPPVAEVTQAGPDELAADDVLLTGLGDGLAVELDDLMGAGLGDAVTGAEVLVTGSGAELDDLVGAGLGVELDDLVTAGLGVELAGELAVLVAGSGAELAADDVLTAGSGVELAGELAVLVTGSVAELAGDEALAAGSADVVEPDCCVQLATIELGGHRKKAPNADTRVSFPAATQAKTRAPGVDPSPTPYRAVHRAGTELAGHFAAPETETRLNVPEVKQAKTVMSKSVVTAGPELRAGPDLTAQWAGRDSAEHFGALSSATWVNVPDVMQA